MNIRCVSLVWILLGALALPSGAQTHPGASHPHGTENSALFQVSTLDALSQGVFEGSYPVRMLRQKGDFGLGTYDGINGEMVVLDGHYYHAYADGTVKEAADDELVPFAAVTYFVPQATYHVSGLSMAEISTFLSSILPSRNLIYAIKITGRFTAVTTRAIPRQTQPYPTLAQATASQSVFNHADIDGTAVVIRSPAFEKGINVVGDHFHFVSKNHQVAGHVLALTTAKVTIEVEILQQTNLWLPQIKPFLDATLPLP